jgi:hypothetical protein
VKGAFGLKMAEQTFIFADVFQGKSQSRILSLNNANFPKGAFAYYSQQSKVIEIDCNN